MKASFKELRETAEEGELRCDACGGTGFPSVMQPVQPGRKIYPAPCRKCGGKGRMTKPLRAL
jgi:DnaJ-class molecular chaperone